MNKFIINIFAAIVLFVAGTLVLEAATPPSNQANFIGLKDITQNGATVSVVNGNGGGRIVVVSTSTITGTPNDDDSFTNHSGDFSAASGTTLTGG